MTRISITVLAFSLSVIAALAFVYFPRLRDKCDYGRIDFNDSEQVSFCKATTEGTNILRRSLSEIYPQAYWMAYVGIAASLSILFYIAWTRKSVGQHRILLRLILVNVAIWYVMLPFTYDWSFWKQDGAVFSLMGGPLFGFPLSLAVMALVTLIPYYSTWYRAGSGFGPDNLFAIFLHLIFVLTAYIQWFYLVPAAWRWWRKKVGADTREQGQCR